MFTKANTKFYIKTLSFDGWGAAIVEMTDAEAEAVKKFLRAETNFGEPASWYGSCRISEGYNSYEEAVEAIRKQHGYLHYDPNDDDE